MEQASIDDNQDGSSVETFLGTFEETSQKVGLQESSVIKESGYTETQCKIRTKEKDIFQILPSNGLDSLNDIEHDPCNTGVQANYNSMDKVTVLNTLPEEIQEELNRHAEYHLLISASNQVHTSQEEIGSSHDQENPLSIDRNPLIVSGGEESGNSITKPDMSYVDKESNLQQDTNRHNYFGSESSSFNIFDASSNLEYLSENHIVEEVALPTVLNDLGIDDDYLKGFVETETDNRKVFYKVPLKHFDLKQKSVKHVFTVNKISNKSTTLLDSSSISKIKKMWAKTSPCPKPSEKKESNKQSTKESNVNKINCRKYDKRSQKETFQSGKKKIERDQTKKHLLLKYGIAPCSVKLFRLTQDKQVTKQNKQKQKKDTNNVKKQRCREIMKTKEQSLIESPNILVTSELITSKYPEKNVNQEEQEQEQDDIDIAGFIDDTESDFSFSEEEYTPSKNRNLGKVFLKSSKTRKTKNDKIAKSVARKIEFKRSDFSPQKPPKRPYHPLGFYRIGRPPVYGHFECRKCDFTANEKNLVEKHNKKVHPTEWMSCRYCERSFKVYDCLLEHEAVKHTKEKVFSCSVDGCDYASTNRTDLSRHQAKHATEKSYSCKICGWMTKWRRNLRSHHLMRHTSHKKFKCSLCKYECKRSTDLKQHMFRHTADKPIQCLTCGFCVKTNWELKSHMLTHSSEKPFKCSHPGCTAATKTNSDLLKHMRQVHKQERDFICKLCNKGFKNQQGLHKHHEFVHEKNRPFKCEICAAGFKCRGNLRKHLLTHTNYKPYQCSVCKKCFSIHTNLKKHMETHDYSKRPFRCPLCPYGAKKSEHLLSHIGAYHGDKYCYFCELCKKPFKRHQRLQLHYKLMHKSELSQFKYGDQVDLALVKMELDLLEEGTKRKKTGKHGKEKKKKARKVDTQIEVSIKQEPNDDGYEPVGHQDTVVEGSVNRIIEEEQHMQGATGSSIDIVNDLILDIIDKAIGQDDMTEDVEVVNRLADNVMDRTDTWDKQDGAQDNKGDVKTQKTHESTDIEITGTCTEDVILMENNNDNENTVSCQNSSQNGNGQDDSTDILDQEVFPGLVIKTHANCIPDFSGNLKEGTLNFTETKNATVAVYTNLRIPLATKGFQFNYEKNGTKPQAWFMDATLMNEKDASKFKKYLRSKGVLPPLPKGKKRKHHLTHFLKKRTEVRNQTILKSKIMKSSKKDPREGLKRQARFKGKYSECEIETCDILNEGIDNPVSRIKTSEPLENKGKPLKPQIMKSDQELKYNQSDVDAPESEGKRKRKPRRTFDIGLDDQKKKCIKKTKPKAQHKNTKTSKGYQSSLSNKETNNFMTGKKSKSVETMFPPRWTKKYIPVKQRKANAKKGEIPCQIDGHRHNKTKALENSNLKPCSTNKLINETKPTNKSNSTHEENNIIGKKPDTDKLQNFCDDVVVLENGSLKNAIHADGYVKHQFNDSQNVAPVNSNEPVHPVCLIENHRYLDYKMNTLVHDTNDEQNLADTQEYSISVNGDIKIESSDVKTEQHIPTY